MWTGIYVNETVERRNFRRRVQQPGETFDDFLIALRDLKNAQRIKSVEGASDGKAYCRKTNSN